MTGIELKKILKEANITLSELAKMLGFDNDQRLHSALSAKDVKSGLIEEIAKATNKSVGFFYGDTQEKKEPNNDALAERLVGLLEKKNEQMDSLIEVIKNFQRNESKNK